MKEKRNIRYKTIYIYIENGKKKEILGTKQLCELIESIKNVLFWRCKIKY